MVSDLVVLRDKHGQFVKAAIDSMQANIEVLADLYKVIKTSFVLFFPPYQSLFPEPSMELKVKEAAGFDVGRLTAMGVSAIAEAL